MRNSLDVEEIVVSTVSAHILEKDKVALHLRAKRTFVDEFGKERLAGTFLILATF